MTIDKMRVRYIQSIARFIGPLVVLQYLAAGVHLLFSMAMR